MAYIFITSSLQGQSSLKSYKLKSWSQVASLHLYILNEYALLKQACATKHINAVEILCVVVLSSRHLHCGDADWLLGRQVGAVGARILLLGSNVPSSVMHFDYGAECVVLVTNFYALLRRWWLRFLLVKA